MMPTSLLLCLSSQTGIEPIFSVFMSLATLATVSVGTQQTGSPVITSLHFFIRFFLSSFIWIQILFKPIARQPRHYFEGAWFLKQVRSSWDDLKFHAT